MVWKTLSRDYKGADPEQAKLWGIVKHSICEGDFVVAAQEIPMQYKDRDWDANVVRLVLCKIENGNIVEFKPVNNRLDLRNFADAGEINPSE